jgi:hypothetical protein
MASRSDPGAVTVSARAGSGFESEPQPGRGGLGAPGPGPAGPFPGTRAQSEGDDVIHPQAATGIWNPRAGPINSAHGTMIYHVFTMYMIPP